MCNGGCPKTVLFYADESRLELSVPGFRKFFNYSKPHCRSGVPTPRRAFRRRGDPTCPAVRSEQGRPQRALSLRQRSKVQEMLPGEGT